MALLTPEEVAGRFGVATSTVWGWVRDGRLKAIRTPGNRIRFTEQEVKSARDRGPDGHDHAGGDGPPGEPDRHRPEGPP